MCENSNPDQGINIPKQKESVPDNPGGRRYNRREDRPPLDVDLKAVCDAGYDAWNGGGETITEIAGAFHASSGQPCYFGRRSILSLLKRRGGIFLHDNGIIAPRIP